MIPVHAGAGKNINTVVGDEKRSFHMYVINRLPLKHRNYTGSKFPDKSGFNGYLLNH